MKILCVAGSRGERAKLAPVVAALEGGHEVAFVHISRSGQVPTWDASASPPEALRLEIGDSTPILRTGAVLRWMEPLLAERGSDLLVTCGASDAALGAALAASLAHVAAAHLDAGVAAVDTAPNAQLLDQTSIFLLAPHLAAVERLAHRGMAHWAYLCGDTLADGPAPVANIVDAAPGPYGLCYLGGPALESPALPAVFDALGRMAMQVLLPAPPSARSSLELHRLAPPENVHLIEPLDYVTMQEAVAGATFVITDSPTLQRESYFRGTLALGLAPADFADAENSGWVRPVAMDGESILEAAKSPPPAQPPDTQAHRGAGARAAQFLTGL